MVDLKTSISLAMASTLLLASVALAGDNPLIDTRGDATGAAPLAQTGPRAASGRLMPFEQAGSRMMLSGEDDSITLSFALGEAAARAGGQLQIAYTNAVSVLPDTARLEVEINGRKTGSFAIRSPNGVKVERIALAADSLKTGRNQVRLRAIQHHRVDCSLDATYELWTRISPKQSGFLSSVATPFSDPMSLLSVAKSDNGFTDIRIVMPPKADPMRLQQALPVVQALALAMNRDDVMVHVDDEPGIGPGVDVHIGRKPETGEGSSTGLVVQDGASAGRASIFIGGTSQQEIDAALLTALSGPLKAALETGILAPKPGVLKARASQEYRLSDAGYRSRPFAGRLFRSGLEIDMPSDFYPADYDTMNLFLNAATAPGLLPSAQFLVRVNDRVVTSFPFRDTAGQTFKNQRIELPLRAFRPGVNRVELLAELPTAADAACQPSERQEDKPRFVLLEESRIEIPALARIGRLPDLSAFAGAAYPYADGKPFTLMVSQPEKTELSAALTTVARLALAAGKPLEMRLAFGRPDASLEGNVLSVEMNGDANTAGDHAESPVAGIDPQTTSATGHADQIFSTGSQKLLEAFAADAAHSEDRSVTAHLQDWIGRVSDRFNSWLRYQDAPETALPPVGERLVGISQAIAPSGKGIWTRIEASSPMALDQGFALLAEPDNWSRLAGGTAAIDTEKHQLLTHSAKTTFIHEWTDWSFGNMRRLAASWFSDNFQIYVLFVFGFMGAFGLWLGVAVPKAGARTKQ